MSAVTMPDIEQVLIDYLLTDFELNANVSDHIWAELPSGAAFPCVTVTRISGRTGFPRWLDAATLQVAGWASVKNASGRKLARDACEQAVRALHEISNEIVDDAVLCGPLFATSPRSVPDVVASGLAHHRFISEVTLTFHPAPAGS